MIMYFFHIQNPPTTPRYNRSRPPKGNPFPPFFATMFNPWEPICPYPVHQPLQTLPIFLGFTNIWPAIRAPSFFPFVGHSSIQKGEWRMGYIFINIQVKNFKNCSNFVFTYLAFACTSQFPHIFSSQNFPSFLKFFVVIKGWPMMVSWKFIYRLMDLGFNRHFCSKESKKVIVESNEISYAYFHESKALKYIGKTYPKYNTQPNMILEFPWNYARSLQNHCHWQEGNSISPFHEGVCSQ
jgi:hypothetical protein